jgi:hypothetical protein
MDHPTWHLCTTLSDPITRHYHFTNSNGESFVIEEWVLLALLKQCSPISVYFESVREHGTL